MDEERESEMCIRNACDKNLVIADRSTCGKSTIHDVRIAESHESSQLACYKRRQKKREQTWVGSAERDQRGGDRDGIVLQHGL